MDLKTKHRAEDTYGCKRGKVPMSITLILSFIVLLGFSVSTVISQETDSASQILEAPECDCDFDAGELCIYGACEVPVTAAGVPDDCTGLSETQCYINNDCQWCATCSPATQWNGLEVGECRLEETCPDYFCSYNSNPNDPHCEAQCDTDDDCTEPREQCDGNEYQTRTVYCTIFDCNCFEGEWETQQDCDDLDGTYCEGDELVLRDYYCNSGNPSDCAYDEIEREDCNDADDYYCDGLELWEGDGFCTGDPGIAYCDTDDILIEDCDDSVSCTDDSCDDEMPACINTPYDKNCYDGVDCTVDTCDPVDDCQYTPDDDYCDDGLWCTIDTCDPVKDCQRPPRDCSGNDFPGIATCDYDPDDFDATFDWRYAFTSKCDEGDDECETGDETINHACADGDDGDGVYYWSPNTITCAAECDGAGIECEAYIDVDTCYYDGSCNTDPTVCECGDYFDEYCPEPGTEFEGDCYWGERDCLDTGDIGANNGIPPGGCTLNVIPMGCKDTCDPIMGPLDTIGPVASNVIAKMNCRYLEVNATVTDTCSNVQEAELYFDGCAGDPDTLGPYSMSAVDGDFNELSEDVTISGIDVLSLLEDGRHRACVRGLDVLGNPGECTCTSFEVDKFPPYTIDQQVPMWSCGVGDDLDLSAVVCDPYAESEICEAEYFMAPPMSRTWNDPDGSGYPMTVDLDAYFYINQDICYPVTATIDVDPLSEGTHYIKVHGKDCACNWGKILLQQNVSFMKDTVAPETTKTVGDPKVKCDIIDDGEGNNVEECWHVTSDTLITLEAEDPNPGDDEFSGNPDYGGWVEIYYRQRWKEDFGDEWDSWGDWVEYTGPFTKDGDSIHELEYYAIDMCGNEEEHRFEIDIVDTVPPETTKELVGPVYVDPETDKTYIDGVTEIHLTCKDPEPHPVDDVTLWWRYKVDDGEFTGWTVYNDPIIFPEESMHTLEYYCEDALGNEEEIQVEIDYVDHTKPVTTKTYGEPQYSGESADYSFAETVDIEGSDYDLEVTVAEDGDWMVWTFDFPVEEFTGDGNLNVGLIIATDGEGNGPAFQIHNNDGATLVEPHGTWMYGSWGPTINDGWFGWPNHDLDVSIESFDWVEATGNRKGQGTDGILQVKIKKSELGESFHWAASPTVGSGFFGAYDDTMQIPADFGWSTPIVDMTVPNYEYAELVREYPKWITSQTPITLIADDGDEVHDSGVAVTKWRNIVLENPDDFHYCYEDCYTWNPDHSGEWNVYDDPFYKEGESCHIIEYYSVDNVEKTEDVKWQCVFVDNTPPETTKDIVGPEYYDDIEDKLYIDGVTEIYLTCEDSEPHPVDDVIILWRYFVDDGEFTNWTEYEGPIIFPEESMHTLEYYCEDALGNEEEVQVEIDYVDHTPPVTTKTYGDPFYTDGTSEWITSQTPVTLTADDGDEVHSSGVAVTYWRNTLVEDFFCESDYDCQMHAQGSGDWNVYEGSFYKPEDSCHLIEYYSVDNVEKTELTKRQCVFVDNQAPNSEKTVGDPKVKCDIIDDGEGNNVEECWYVTSDTPITLICKDPDPHPVDDVAIYYRQRWKEDFDDNWDPWDDWVEYIDPFTKDVDSIHELEWYCIDALNNEEKHRYEIDIVDNQEPETTKVIVGPQYTDKEQACIDSGGTVTTSMCCGAVGDFPNLCATGACGCAPENSHEVQICDCGPGDCFDGSSCIPEDSYPGEGNSEPAKTYIDGVTEIRLTCEDPEPHPVDDVIILWRYFVDGELVEDWDTYEGPIIFPEESMHTLEYYCEDALGNKEEVQVEIDYVDHTPPVTEKEYGDPFYTNDISEWITSQTPVTLTADDGDESHDSGVAVTYWRNTLVPDEMCSNVELCSCDSPEEEVFDLTGDVSGTVTKTDNGDSFTWTISITSPNPPHNRWGVGMAFATDTSQPAFQAWYREYEEPYGWYYQEYTGTGWHGWGGDVIPLPTEGITATGDHTGQVFTITIPKSKLGESCNEFHWGAQARTNLLGKYPDTWIPWAGGSEEVSGMAISQNGNSGAFNEYTEPFYKPEDSCHLIEYYSVDNVEKTEEVKYQCVFVDNQAPDLWKTIGEPKIPCDLEDPTSCDYWVRDHVTPIDLYCDDRQPHPVNGEKLWYRILLDGRVLQDWTDPTGGHKQIIFQEDSVHTLEYYCEDELGNSNGTRDDPHVQVYRVDSTPPTTAKEIGDCNYEDGEDLFVSCETPFTLTAEDGGPICAIGVDEIEYEIEGDHYTYTEPFNLSEYDEGYITIEYWSSDTLGNTEEVNTEEDILDCSPPEITDVYPEDGTYVCDFTIRFTVTDQGAIPSGVNQESISVSGPTGFDSMADCTTEDGGLSYYCEFEDDSECVDGIVDLVITAQDNVCNEVEWDSQYTRDAEIVVVPDDEYVPAKCLECSSCGETCCGDSPCVTVTATVYPAGNFTLTETCAEITFATNLGVIQPPATVPLDENLQASVIFYSQVAGVATITATNGCNEGDTEVNVYVCTGNILDVWTDPDEVPADGESTSTVWVQGQDELGNPAPSMNGLPVLCETDLGLFENDMDEIILTLNAMATATTTISSDVAGIATIVCSAGALSDSDTVEFIGEECDPSAFNQLEISQAQWQLISVPKLLDPANFSAVFEIDDLLHNFLAGLGWRTWSFANMSAEVEPLLGYWAWSNSNAETVILSYLNTTGPGFEPPVLELQIGWNLIGLGDTCPTTLGEALSGLDWVVLHAYDGQWSTEINGVPTNFQMEPGVGYWVYLNSPGTYTGTL